MKNLSELDVEIKNFIDSIDSIESTEFNLGRPEIEIMPEMESLAKEGKNAVSAIISHLDENQPKRLAYLVHTISMIEENDEAIDVIKSIREKMIKRPDKTEWDYAAIGECNLLLSR